VGNHPEPGIDELMHPPRVPALQRAPGNTDPLGQLLHPPVAQTGPQGTCQNHRSGPVDATTQEPNRHRCVAFVATRAGETQAPSIGFTRIARSTTRFARIEIAMQRCPATSAAARSGLGSQVFIDAQKKCAERGVQQRPVAHWEGLFCLGGLKRHSTLPRGSVDPDSRGRPPPFPHPIRSDLPEPPSKTVLVVSLGSPPLPVLTYQASFLAPVLTMPISLPSYIYCQSTWKLAGNIPATVGGTKFSSAVGVSAVGASSSVG